MAKAEAIAPCAAGSGARCGIGFFSTAFDAPSFDLLSELGCLPMVKIPSGELTNLPLLRHMTRQGKPVLLSTGASTLGEIDAAVVGDARPADPRIRPLIPDAEAAARAVARAYRIATSSPDEPSLVLKKIT